MTNKVSIDNLKHKDIKFLHVANHRHENLFQAPIMIGGFYNWHLAMGGEFNLFKMKEGTLNNYDVIFIGMSKPELDGACATRIRREIGTNSKTKLVICIDYAIELWQNIFNPHALETELLNADVIFISEPTMVNYVRTLLNDKVPVHHLVHPSNIDVIRKIRKPIEQRTEEIVTIIHRYDNNWLSPYLVTKDLPWNTHAVLLDGNLEKHLYAFFKYMRQGFEFTQFLDWSSRMKVVLDSYHKLHTYGRNAVDNACLGLPTVGSNWTYAQNYLWPDLATEPSDLIRQKNLITKLMTNETFYRDCVKKADKLVEKFSYKNRKQELLKILYN